MRYLSLSVLQRGRGRGRGLLRLEAGESSVCGIWFHPLQSVTDGFGETVHAAKSEGGGQGGLKQGCQINKGNKSLQAGRQTDTRRTNLQNKSKHSDTQTNKNSQTKKKSNGKQKQTNKVTSGLSKVTSSFSFYPIQVHLP